MDPIFLYILLFIKPHKQKSRGVKSGDLGGQLMVQPVADRMTGQNYLDFLQNELPKQLEDVPLATRIAMYFQHDGAPSHYT